MKNSKKENLTDEQTQPIFEKMLVYTVVGVNGRVGQRSAGI